MLHELNQRFNSPTVNLFFSSSDFIKLISNLRYYLSLEVVEVESDKSYPVGMIGDITINFMHYSSFIEAKNKWEERKKRVDYNNLYIIMVQGADCTYDMIKEFDEMPYEKKVIFTGKDYPEIKSAVHIWGTEREDGYVKDLCLYKSKFTGKRLLDDFDYVSFFNS